MDDKLFVITDNEGIVPGSVDPMQTPIKETTATKKPAGVRMPRTAKQDPAPARKPGRPSKSDLEREVATEIQAMLTLGSAIWANYDEECPVVLSAQSKDIANALAGILAKHPALLAKMRDATGFGDYITLAVAIMPVVKAISAHHVAPGLKKREEEDFANAS